MCYIDIYKLLRIIGVPASMQKLMYKGLAKDEKTLEELGVVKGAKLMVVGSTLTDILAVSSTPTQEQLKEETSTGISTLFIPLHFVSIVYGAVVSHFSIWGGGGRN